MKKIILKVLTVICGMFGFHCTISAAVISFKIGDYSTAIFVGFFGVVLPVVALEVVKVFLKRYEKDILGINISALALILINIVYISDGIFGSSSWIKDFIPLQLPWIVSLFVQILFYVYKSRKVKNKNVGDGSQC